MICVVDASVAVKWFVRADWALREAHIEPALALLRASTEGAIEFVQPPHFLAEVAAVLARLNPQATSRDIANLADLDIAWAEPTQALDRAIELAIRLDHPLFDTLYHALALTTPGAVLVTADQRYFAKACSLGRIAWLPDFSAA